MRCQSQSSPYQEAWRRWCPECCQGQSSSQRQELALPAHGACAEWCSEVQDLPEGIWRVAPVCLQFLKIKLEKFLTIPGEIAAQSLRVRTTVPCWQQAILRLRLHLTWDSWQTLHLSPLLRESGRLLLVRSRKAINFIIAPFAISGFGAVTLSSMRACVQMSLSFRLGSRMGSPTLDSP